MIDPGGHHKVFLEEMDDLLGEFESSMLEVESGSPEGEGIASAFRAMHTIKGAASMFGFQAIAQVAHALEAVLDLLRSGRLAPTENLFSVSFEVRDAIGGMVDIIAAAGEPPSEPDAALIQKIASLMPEGTAIAPSNVTAPKNVSAPSSGAAYRETNVYHIRFRPPGDIFLRGIDPLIIFNELVALGSCRVMIDHGEIPELSNIIADHCYPYWDITLMSPHGREVIEEIFSFVEDSCELEIKMDTPDIKNALHGDVCSKPSGKASKASGGESRSVRVDTDKLDMLVNLIGEMVTVQSSLSELALQWDDLNIFSQDNEMVPVEQRKVRELLVISEKMQRLVSDLRDNTMNIRMVPIGKTLKGFRRLVRDLSIELGKEVDFTTAGEETELDKTLIEHLHDPLVHLIRNAVDHGIESPDERLKKGKSAKGAIHISAEHAGASVLIHVHDDGAGLNKKAIIEHARKKGLASDGERLSDAQIFSLVLEPGFSTSKSVTSVSGRGVGMDVVRRNIEALRGTVQLRSSEGLGTTISLRLPLTLAIIDGLLVRVGKNHYIIPLSDVDESIDLSISDIRRSKGSSLVYVRGEAVPYISLGGLFGSNGNGGGIKEIVIARKNNMRIGLAVDGVVGEHQTVIKSLGGMYKGSGMFSGASILGDGSVALILDIGNIAGMSFEKAAQNYMTL